MEHEKEQEIADESVRDQTLDSDHGTEEVLRDRSSKMP